MLHVPPTSVLYGEVDLELAIYSSATVVGVQRSVEPTILVSMANELEINTNLVH